MVPLELGVALIKGGRCWLRRRTGGDIVRVIGASVDRARRIGIIGSRHFYCIEVGVRGEAAVDFWGLVKEIAVLGGESVVEAHAEAC